MREIQPFKGAPEASIDPQWSEWIILSDRVQMSSGLWSFCNSLLRVLEFTLEQWESLKGWVSFLHDPGVCKQPNSLEIAKECGKVKNSKGTLKCSKISLILMIYLGKEKPTPELSEDLCFPSHPILSCSLCNPLVFLTKYSPIWESWRGNSPCKSGLSPSPTTVT